MLIIDGYNLLYQLPSLLKKGKEKARDILIHRLEEKVKTFGEIWLVFDGSRGGRRDFSRKIHVIYTEEESADEYIKRLVIRKKREKVEVVTDDREIQEFVRIEGGEIIQGEEFRRILFPPSPPSPSPPERKPTPSSPKGRKITRELEEVLGVGKDE